MPFAGFKNFDTCVLAQKKKGKSDKSARKICGYLQKKAEGKDLSEDEINNLLAQAWIEDVLNRDEA